MESEAFARLNGDWPQYHIYMWHSRVHIRNGWELKCWALKWTYINFWDAHPSPWLTHMHLPSSTHNIHICWSINRSIVALFLQTLIGGCDLHSECTDFTEELLQHDITTCRMVWLVFQQYIFDVQFGGMQHIPRFDFNILWYFVICSLSMASMHPSKSIISGRHIIRTITVTILPLCVL